MSQEFDVCVLGAGPGGYVAAIRAAQLGLKTCVVEREYLGGVCLNVGCIPSKALISASHFYHRAQHEAATMGIEISGSIKVDMGKLQAWKKSVCDRMSGGVAQLLKGNKITLFMGQAEFVSPQELEVQIGTSKEKIKAKNFIIATGSRPIEIPGFKYDEKTILSSTGGLALSELPRRMMVIGGGYIGLELGTLLQKLGSEVTVLEAGDALLSGVVEPDIVQLLSRRLKKNGIQVKLKAKAQSYKMDATGAIVVTALVDGKSEAFTCDKVLVTVGRKPNSDQAGIKKIGLALDAQGCIQVNAQRRTNIPHIYAIGDIAGQPMLAHKASYEGILVAEVISGKKRAYDAKTVPAVIFTDPEISAVGWTEAECIKNGFKNLKIGKFPFAANGRAVSILETEGFVKVIADKETHRILGVHMIGPEVSNLISEAGLAIEMGAQLEDLALTIHPHPTLSEPLMEACESALGHAIHIIQKTN